MPRKRRHVREATPMERAVIEARRSARLARAGYFLGVEPEHAEDYARRREVDAVIIVAVYLGGRDPGYEAV